MIYTRGFPGGSGSKVFACNARDLDLIPGLGRSPREGNGNSLQRSCLENPGTEEPGDLQLMGSQRVGHDWATKHIIKAIRNIPDQNRWQKFTNEVSSLPLPRYNTKVILEYIWGYSFHIILHHNTLFPNIPILGITIPSDSFRRNYM